MNTCSSNFVSFLYHVQDTAESYMMDADGHFELRHGTGGMYSKSLRPGRMLSNLLCAVPELRSLAQLELQVITNKDSSNFKPSDWVRIAKKLHANRDKFDAFLIVHGTDTMSFTAAALSFMLAGFRKPIVLTGSQIPLALPRSDARQNLLDALTCATAAHSPPYIPFQEVAICFGGRLLRGNRASKVNTNNYQAFDSPSYPPLCSLGVNLEWNRDALLQPSGVYRPRFELETQVIRVPVVPGSDPRICYGDLVSRGVKGIVLEAFGTGNLPDKTGGWMSWLRKQRKAGLAIYMRSQSSLGPLAPELYHSGSEALKLGVEAGPQLTAEAAAVKMMLCLKYPDIPMAQPLAGEL